MSVDMEYKVDRYGAVVVFRPNVTKAQAERAMKRLEREGLIEPKMRFTAEGFAPGSHVEGFDSRWGGPVWYVP